MTTLLTWPELELASASAVGGDRSRSLSPSSQALLRLFDAENESKVRVTLFRDFHAWCRELLRLFDAENESKTKGA
jgi:hypothetical protein